MLMMPPRRRGVTLLELLVVVTLIGIFTAVAATRLGTGGRGNFASQANGRTLSLDLLLARRAAIANGDNHYVKFTMNGGFAEGYQIFRRDPGGDVAIDSYRTFQSELSVTVSHTEAEFNFEGQALASYQVVLKGPDRTWQVDVTISTGGVKVSET